ncbi:metabotropic glutamate receptor 8-like [Saccoglossus kowalevskii]|uniref:Metabotropic glutamate receptor 8-like n=1 Tax=Saccoglossus kowalevskii TaxID=10224 RepID=A0ABM0GVP8_SACKO|nr:PREDICTED: metabotropic glutamate receptor 8-like [Saccoglossus kowalevskii]
MFYTTGTTFHARREHGLFSRSVDNVVFYIVLVSCIDICRVSGLGDSVKIPGDVVLGGLFPIHSAGIGKPCGYAKKEQGIQRMEAMLYAIDMINKRTDLLPNITLGAHILDTCSRDTYALEQSMQFVGPKMGHVDLENVECPNGSDPIYSQPQPVAGVAGASSSSVSVMVANILGLFQIPQISYASTSSELSDKSRYNYFSRVVPPDSYQAQAMIDLVQAFGWEYVSTVASEGNYGEGGVEAFTQLAKNTGICIAKSEKIYMDSLDSSFDRIVEYLFEKTQARGVITFVNEDDLQRLLQATERNNMTGHFIWIASDSWGTKDSPVEDQERVAEGAITILPKQTALSGFDKYFQALNPTNNTRNPWFKEFWESFFKCKFNESVAANADVICTGHEQISSLTGYRQEGLVQFVVDAVLSFAYALQKMKEDRCPDSAELCDAMKPVQGLDLLSYVRNARFTGSAGTEIRFNDNGDAPGRYNIFQFQLVNNTWTYLPIGEWEEVLDLDISKTIWGQKPPDSVCSHPCPSGMAMKRNVGEKCCWVCTKCAEYEYLPDHATCEDCGPGFWPNDTKTGCYEIPQEYTTWTSAWAIATGAFALTGIIFEVFIIAIFIAYNNTPLIRASGRELMFVLLFGIFICYGMTFVIMTKPTPTKCCMERLGLGLCLVTCYAALLTKTNRISRIFNQGIKSAIRPKYTSPKSQIVICVALISLQVLGVTVWLVLDPPQTRVEYISRDRAVLRCATSDSTLMTSLLYNMLLIVLCTVYAFKTRKIPENFNEAKFIGFTMYTTCIVWLAFLCIYFGTSDKDPKIQMTSLSFTVSMSASVVLVLLFVPKVYIVVFQPHKNVRQATKVGTRSQSTMNGREYTRTPATSSSDVALRIASSTSDTRESFDDILFEGTDVADLSAIYLGCERQTTI